MGVLTIDVKRNACEYAVVEMKTPWRGRAFVLAKIDCGTDEDVTAYEVFCGSREETSCDCRGFTRWSGCKHVSAMKALIANHWI